METVELHPEVQAILNQIPDDKTRRLYSQVIHPDLRLEAQKVIATRLVKGYVGYTTEELEERRKKALDDHFSVTPEERKKDNERVMEKLAASNAAAVRDANLFGADAQWTIDQVNEGNYHREPVLNLAVLGTLGVGRGVTGTFVVEAEDGKVLTAFRITEPVREARTFWGKVKAFFKGQVALFRGLFA